MDGEITIDSPNQVTGTVGVLETPVFDVSRLVEDRCAAAVLRERSSFTVEGQEGLAPAPSDYAISPWVCGEDAEGEETPPGDPSRVRKPERREEGRP